MAGFYTFVRKVSGKLGVGVADEAYIPNTGLPNYSGIGAERQVRRVLSTRQAPLYQPGQRVPTVSGLGTTGSFVHGVPVLAPLAKKG
jgi:hypothetical protein